MIGPEVFQTEAKTQHGNIANDRVFWGCSPDRYPLPLAMGSFPHRPPRKYEPMGAQIRLPTGIE